MGRVCFKPVAYGSVECALFMVEKNGQSIKARGIEIRRSFMRARCGRPTDWLLARFLARSALYLFPVPSYRYAFYGTNGLIAHHRNAVEQRKPVTRAKRDARAPVQGHTEPGKVQDCAA